MRGNIISDTTGRLRVRFQPQELGPESFENLGAELMRSGEVKYVSFSRLTGSLLVYYEKGEKRRKFVLDTISSFEPDKRVPVSCFEDRTLEIGEEAPMPINPIYGFVLRWIFLPRTVRIAVEIVLAVPYVISALKSLLWENSLDVELLDGAALTVCYARWDYRSAGTLIFFYALSEYLEDWTKRKSMASLFHSLKGQEEKVWIKNPDGNRVQVKESELEVGSHVVILAGGLIPVDGIVEEGEAMVNQATMTGEPLPVRMVSGGAVFAGTAVEEGEIVVRATKVGRNTRIRSIMEYIKESEESKSGLQGRVERLADSIVPFNFLLMLATFLITRDMTKAGNALLVHYSCVIRLSTPVVVLSAMKEGNESGFLIKGGRYLEELAEADTCVFDKTGTITEAKPHVAEIITFKNGEDKGYTRDKALTLAACLEEHFPHPVGRAVVNQAKKEGLSHEEELHTKVNYVVAHGISSTVNDEKVVLGSYHFVMEDEKIPFTPEAQEAFKRIAEQGDSMIYLGIGGTLAAIIVISDKIRFRVKETLDELREQGVKRAVMLTGDLKSTARTISEKVGFDEYKAQLLPDDKAAYVSEKAAEGAKIMMVGDGINDSAALSLARVGVALSDGSALARDVANVQLMNGRLDALPVARLLSERAMKRTRENYWLIVSLNTLYLFLGFLGITGAALTSLAHNATTVYVALRATKPFLESSERNLPQEKEDAAA
ncbi:MAG: heavy metal translocating P-type ATPase [Deltaproteobacteria bacterium]|jgi:Cu2+-exporting ATPase|nr:heavy metal translocating P-type ATPase [Deltaproteobacteria bacterium]